MAKKIKPKNEIPDSPELWVAEIAMAFQGARAFMDTPLVANIADIDEMQPWHVAPLMAVGARGLSENEDLLDEAAGFAYASFEENYGLEQAGTLPPEIAFAFVYVASHLGLKLIEINQADQIMDLIEANEDALGSMIEKAGEMLKENNPFEFFALAGPSEFGGEEAEGELAPRPARKGARKGAAGKVKKAAPHSGEIYELEIELRDIEPRIWRRVAVPGDFTLAQLHRVIQILFAWDEDHLHDFRAGKKRYTIADYADSGDLDESEFTLAQVAARTGSRLLYTYDYGDSWEHEIVVRKIEKPEPGVPYPVCLGGERAAPPEDCGGVWGYEEILAALKDPENEAYAERLEWLGEGYDPEVFDLKTINQSLGELAKRRKLK